MSWIISKLERALVTGTHLWPKAILAGGFLATTIVSASLTVSWATILSASLSSAVSPSRQPANESSEFRLLERLRNSMGTASSEYTDEVTAEKVRIQGPAFFVKLINAPEVYAPALRPERIFAVASGHVVGGRAVQLRDHRGNLLSIRRNAISRLDDIAIFEVQHQDLKDQSIDFNLDIDAGTLNLNRRISYSALDPEFRMLTPDRNPQITRFNETAVNELVFSLAPAGQQMIAETYGAQRWLTFSAGPNPTLVYKRQQSLAEDALGNRFIGLAQIYPGYSGSPVFRFDREKSSLEVVGFISQSHRILPLTYIVKLKSLIALASRYRSIVSEQSLTTSQSQARLADANLNPAIQESRDHSNLKLTSFASDDDQNFMSTNLVNSKKSGLYNSSIGQISKEWVEMSGLGSAQVDSNILSRKVKWILRNGETQLVYADQSVESEGQARLSGSSGGKTSGDGGGKTSGDGGGKTSGDGGGKTSGDGGGKTSGDGGGKTSGDGGGAIPVGDEHLTAKSRRDILNWQNRIFAQPTPSNAGDPKQNLSSYLLVKHEDSFQNLVIEDSPQVRAWLSTKSVSGLTADRDSSQNNVQSNLLVKECLLPQVVAMNESSLAKISRECQPVAWLKAKLTGAFASSSQPNKMVLKARASSPIGLPSDQSEVFLRNSTAQKSSSELRSIGTAWAEVELKNDDSHTIRFAIGRRQFQITIDAHGNLDENQSSLIARGDRGFFPQIFEFQENDARFTLDIRGLYYFTPTETDAGMGSENNLMTMLQSDGGKPGQVSDLGSGLGSGNAKIFVRDMNRKVIYEFQF